jgi:hypothetical protein
LVYTPRNLRLDFAVRGAIMAAEVVMAVKDVGHEVPDIQRSGS